MDVHGPYQIEYDDPELHKNSMLKKYEVTEINGGYAEIHGLMVSPQYNSDIGATVKINQGNAILDFSNSIRRFRLAGKVAGFAWKNLTKAIIQQEDMKMIQRAFKSRGDEHGVVALRDLG